MKDSQEKKWCVYKHINKVNGKVYIGQTCQKPENRWGNGSNYKPCTLFYRAIMKYGWDGFEHKVVEDNLTFEQANFLEEKLIKELKSNEPEYGYNLKSGGSNGIPNEEVKQKMKDNHADYSGENHPKYGTNCSEETKNKIREANKKYKGENHPFYGKHHSEEAKKKMSEAHKKIPVSQKALERSIEVNKGKHLTKDHKEAISKANSGANNKRSKPVICLETNEIFDSAGEASRKKNVSKDVLIRCCNKKVKTCGGLHWEYIENIKNQYDEIVNIPRPVLKEEF